MTSAALMERVFARADQMGLAADLPRLAGLPAERVAAMRASGGVVSAAEYEALCRALAVDPASMYRGEEGRPGRAPSRFRAAISHNRPNASDVRLLALAAEQGRILAHLLRRMDRPIRLVDLRQTVGVMSSGETWRQGYALGEQARDRLALPAGPIADIEQLLRDLGVHVARVTFGSGDVDGASIWEPGAVPIVLLNQASPRAEHPGARRATLCHELCHLLHDAGEQELTTTVSFGAEQRGNYAEGVEVRARAFAPAFLAPRSQVVGWADRLSRARRVDDRKLVEALAAEWGLSFEGAAWHAKNCGLVSPARAKQLATHSRKPRISYDAFEAARAGVPPSMWNEALPDVPAKLWEGRATEIVLGALEEGHITIGRANELLTWA